MSTMDRIEDFGRICVLQRCAKAVKDTIRVCSPEYHRAECVRLAMKKRLDEKYGKQTGGMDGGLQCFAQLWDPDYHMMRSAELTKCGAYERAKWSADRAVELHKLQELGKIDNLVVMNGFGG